MKRALELDPGSLHVHTYYGTLLMHLGRHDEAIREGRIAVNWIRCRRQAAQLWAGFFTARGDMRKLYRICSARLLEPRSVAANHRLGDVYAQWAGMMKPLLHMRKTES